MPVKTWEANSFERLNIGLFVPARDNQVHNVYPANYGSTAHGEGIVGEWDVAVTEGPKNYHLPEIEVRAAQLVVSGIFDAKKRELSLIGETTAGKQLKGRVIDLSEEPAFALLGVGKQSLMFAERDRSGPRSQQQSRGKQLDKDGEYSITKPGFYNQPSSRPPTKHMAPSSRTGQTYVSREMRGRTNYFYYPGAVRISGILTSKTERVVR